MTETTINVLHLRDTFEIGGPGKTILETYRAIDAARFRLHLGVFLTRHESAETPFVSAARAVGLPVHEIRGLNQYDPRMIARVIQLVDDLHIHLVHAHEVKSDVITWLVSKFRRVPVVTTLHGWFGTDYKARLFTALDRRVVRSFDRVIAVSGPIHDRMAAAGITERQLRLLRNAIVIERYRRTGERGYLASLLGRPVAGPVVATIGRLSPEKGHADFVEALALARVSGCRVTAVLAGDGPARADLVARVHALGFDDAVHFPGYVDRPERLLEETDLMVLPSHTEGFPNVVLEALAMEVPVLATRVGGTPEIVEDGTNGRLVPPHSPPALADALKQFVAAPDHWRRMAQNGRELVERSFDFKARTRRLESIYMELVREGLST